MVSGLGDQGLGSREVRQLLNFGVFAAGDYGIESRSRYSGSGFRV